MNEQKQTHISESKKGIVGDLVKSMNKKTIMIVSVKGLPSPQLQSIRKKLRDIGAVKIAKKSLIRHALEESNNEELRKLEDFVDENCAIVFSDDNAFELSAFLSENKSPAKAKPGQQSPEDLKIEAGPTSLIPGPDISLLGSIGLQVKVENGKLAIQNSKVIVKKGETISATVAAILAKLDITPFSIGLEPIAAFYDGKIYEEIKINKDETLEELTEKFSRCLAFAVSIAYPTKETLVYILGKAAAHESALAGLIKSGGENAE